MVFDTLGFIALILTFASVLFSLKLSIDNTILAIGLFLLGIAGYIYIFLKNTIDEHTKEINKINEKINIYKDIADLKAKVELMMNNFNMKKRGTGDLVEILIRIVQIVAIVVAGYLILKALGFIF